MKNPKRNNKKFVYIDRNGGMTWEQINAQAKNIYHENKLSNKHRQLKPKKK